MFADALLRCFFVLFYFHGVADVLLSALEQKRPVRNPANTLDAGLRMKFENAVCVFCTIQ
jgi:hypothetical protein